jgi:hypothetical protein
MFDGWTRPAEDTCNYKPHGSFKRLFTFYDITGLLEKPLYKVTGANVSTVVLNQTDRNEPTRQTHSLLLHQRDNVPQKVLPFPGKFT